MSLNRQLIEAATNGNLEKVENVLGQGADIHTNDVYGPDAPLRGAARNGHLDIVKFLVFRPGLVRNARAPPGVSHQPERANIHTDDVYGPNAAVREAASNGHLDVLRFLVENGVDIRAADWDSPDAAMRRAAQYGHLDVVRFLCEKGADIHAADWDGPDAAVCWAALNGHLPVVRFLVNPRKYGVDRDGSDRNILAQKYSEVLVKIQQLEQEQQELELYQNARVMYYALYFAQQNQYSKGERGASVQALQESLC